MSVLSFKAVLLHSPQKTNNRTGIPSDAVARAQMAQFSKRWGVYPPVIDDLKVKAKKLGIWNLFLSKTHYKEGAGFTNLEYGLIAMILGKSSLASEVKTCSCPASNVPTNLCLRLSTALHQILETWKSLQSTEPMVKRRNGYNRFSMAQFVQHF
jgi:hypothetical protein